MRRAESQPGTPAFFDPSADPPLGSPLPAVLAVRHDVYGRAVPDQSETLVVYGGTCSDCSLAQVSPKSLPSKAPGTTWMVFDVDPTEVVKSLGKAPPSNVLVFADPRASFSLSANAAWVGRWYKYRSGSLAAVQREPQEPPW